MKDPLEDELDAIVLSIDKLASTLKSLEDKLEDVSKRCELLGKEIDKISGENNNIE